jgi:hypothetical protein
MSAEIGPLLNYTTIDIAVTPNVTIEAVVNLKRVKVHFVVDFGAIIHTATQSPYSMPWAPPGMGRHLLVITVHRRRFRRRRVVTCKVIGLMSLTVAHARPSKLPWLPFVLQGTDSSVVSHCSKDCTHHRNGSSDSGASKGSSGSFPNGRSGSYDESHCPCGGAASSVVSRRRQLWCWHPSWRHGMPHRVRVYRPWHPHLPVHP